MNTLFMEIGIFNVALVLAMFFKTHADRKEYRDCLLFSRLLLATVAILTVDTIGWVIDGHPIGGQIWPTVVIDGLDLIFTTLVCWCWVQYACYIAEEENWKKKKWYRDIATLCLILQVMLVILSQIFDFYYKIDAQGVYHRSRGYVVHTFISMILLSYSSIKCVIAYRKSEESDRRKELAFVAFIILVPILGNIVQLFVYGYPTVWICMVFMVLLVYIHIQNKRTEEEREAKNRELKRALEQAEAANIAKTEFLTRMSHDMRTPMNGILGITCLMEDETDVKDLKKEIPKIRESGEYLLQLINDVLDVNKIESGKVELQPKLCEEEKVFDSIIAMVKPEMERKSISFHFEKINIQWTNMMLDAQRVKQIFVNLLTNAVKYTQKGGKIDFIMELVSEDETTIRDKFIIRDNGIGMSETFLPNAFKPFAQEGRMHENLGGTGLGLTIVKSLVELMGGTIEIKSTINQGTEFILYLNFPLAKESNGIYTENQQEENMEFPEGLKVLLCEDHPLNAEITSRLLKKKKANVVWKENGMEGIKTFEKSEPGYFDVILMDIRMPVMDGLETTRKIRALEREDAKRIPIIAMTADAYENDRMKSFEAGMSAHLAKPIEPKNMYQTIVKMIHDEKHAP